MGERGVDEEEADDDEGRRLREPFGRPRRRGGGVDDGVGDGSVEDAAIRAVATVSDAGGRTDGGADDDDDDDDDGDGEEDDGDGDGALPPRLARRVRR